MQQRSLLKGYYSLAEDQGSNNEDSETLEESRPLPHVFVVMMKDLVLATVMSAHKIRIQQELASGYFNQSIASGCCGVDGCDNLGQSGLNKAPSVLAQYHDRDLSVAEVLLIDEVLISGKKQVKSGFFGHAQQLSIEQRTPSLFPGGFYGMALQTIANANGLFPDRKG